MKMLDMVRKQEGALKIKHICVWCWRLDLEHIQNKQPRVALVVLDAPPAVLWGHQPSLGRQALLCPYRVSPGANAKLP